MNLTACAFFWKQQRNFPKFSPAPLQRKTGQLSRESLAGHTGGD